MRRLRLVPDNTKIPFFRYRWIAFVWSLIVLVGTVVLISINGLNMGIDFKGGVLLEVRTQGPADLAAMRSSLGDLGLGEVTLQTAGGEDQVMIRAEAPEADEAAQRAAVEQIKVALAGVVGAEASYQRAEFVGPRVSQELLVNSIWAVGISLLGVLLYLWFRFEWQFSVGVVLGLFHDVLVTAGIFSFFQLGFDLSIVAALLTILGYSVNDSVVVADRIRENLRKYKKMPLTELLNLSINETLSRTILTGVTTIAVLLALFFLGGEVIQNFTFAMLFGVLIGTYSSIFIAAPVIDFLGIKRDWSETPAAAKTGGGGATAARP